MELQALHTFAFLNFYIDVQLYSMRALGMLYFNVCIKCYNIVTLKCYSVMLCTGVYESQHINAVALQYYHI
jgi:hypothetical protein